VRATWLTDLHLNFVRPRALAAFHAKVAAESPDALFVTGDTAEAPTLAGFLDGLAAAARAPVYFVLGNHDFYRSSLQDVRAAVQRDAAGATYLPAAGPLQLTERTTLVGVDGWGDARCGDLESKLSLSDWQLIADFQPCLYDRPARADLLRGLGAAEAVALADQLARVAADTRELVVLTHVPPFPEACIYNGEVSEPSWLPFFTCVATGEVLVDYARRHDTTNVVVLCGHSHGVGSHRPLPNLEVRTGGWPPNVEGYGNPIIQATLDL
jgi:predicted MPP superfamily phosphohydrolase